MRYLLALQGSTCPIIYLVAPTSLGRSPTSYEPWMRTDFMATAFDSPAGALAARDALLNARAYEAPECNDNLAKRLMECVIFEIPEWEVGQTVWKDGAKVHIVPA